MTSIAVLGAGDVGTALIRKWAATAHDVVIGTRDPAQADIVALAGETGAAAASHSEAVARSDVVVFALPGTAVAPVCEALGSVLDSKLVIDATNTLGAPVMNNVATITQHAPGASIARAFNSVGWENFAEPDFDGIAADMLWCGPDGPAGETIAALIADVGMRPVYVGGLDQLPVVDMLASLWFALALGQGRGRHLAFRVLMR